jgi:hypothetical protein
VLVQLLPEDDDDYHSIGYATTTESLTESIFQYIFENGQYKTPRLSPMGIKDLRAGSCMLHARNKRAEVEMWSHSSELCDVEKWIRVKVHVC